MTQPEYRVIQALLTTSRGEAATEIAAKEAYVDSVLERIESGTAFEEAVGGIEPYAFTGGDLGWRKLGDIPSMFAAVVPDLSIGEVAKVRSTSGFHLVYLADALGGERLVRQTDVRHILIKPTEVLSDAAAESWQEASLSEFEAARTLARWLASIRMILGLQLKVANSAGRTQGKWCRI